MPFRHFLTCLDSNEYQTLGFLMFPHQEHVWIIGCVFNTPCPICAFSMHQLHCILPLLAHNFPTLVMHWSIPCFFILACHVYFMLCNLVMFSILKFIFSFILHPSCIILLINFFISCLLFSLTTLSIRVKKGESILQSVYRRVLSFLYDSCAHP